MKVFLHGRDNVGWALDIEWNNTARILQENGHALTRNFLRADVVHSVWFNTLLRKKFFPLRLKKRLIAAAQSEINPNSVQSKRYYEFFLQLKRSVSLWIAPNRNQFEIFKNMGVPVEYVPNLVDSREFTKLNLEKKELAELLGVDFNLIRDKFIIGSFQRDTEGGDLKTPKIHKNPELLIETISSLPRNDTWILFLAGPRRHYVIEQCEKRGIPYFYYGKTPQPGIDDLQANMVDQKKMTLLYNLVDCNLINSRWEGGPRGVLESSLCRTLILSTYVGVAPDILDDRCLYRSAEEARAKIIEAMNGAFAETRESIVETNYNRVMQLCSYDAVKARWQKIYDSLS